MSQWLAAGAEESSDDADGGDAGRAGSGLATAVLGDERSLDAGGARVASGLPEAPHERGPDPNFDYLEGLLNGTSPTPSKGSSAGVAAHSGYPGNASSQKSAEKAAKTWARPPSGRPGSALEKLEEIEREASRGPHEPKFPAGKAKEASRTARAGEGKDKETPKLSREEEARQATAAVRERLAKEKATQEEDTRARPEKNFADLMSAWSEKGAEKLKEHKAALPSFKKGRPEGIDAVAREMREATHTSPLLARLRMQLAEEKVSRPPPEYVSFSQQLAAARGQSIDFRRSLEQLRVAAVMDVARVKSVPEYLKVPMVVEARKGWRPRAWSMAFWSYEAGEEVCKCFRRYPPRAADRRPAESLEVRVDEFSKYVGVLRDMDPNCVEESSMAYPRFFVGGWNPFAWNAVARKLWDEEWQSGRQLWQPPGIRDYTAKWMRKCGAVLGLDVENTMATLDRVQLGPPGAVTRLHVENNSAHAWYGQIQGRRAFILFSPQEGQNLYAKETGEPEPGSEERKEHSPVDLYHPDDERHPKLKESRAQVVILNPGEMLVVPRGWWLYSVVLEASTTLSRRFWDRTNRTAFLDEFSTLFSSEAMAPAMRTMFHGHMQGLRRSIQDDNESDEDA